MVHFTCDLCGVDLPATGSPRFVVRIGIYAAPDQDRIRDECLVVDEADDEMCGIRR